MLDKYYNISIITHNSITETITMPLDDLNFWGNGKTKRLSRDYGLTVWAGEKLLGCPCIFSAGDLNDK